MTGLWRVMVASSWGPAAMVPLLPPCRHFCCLILGHVFSPGFWGFCCCIRRETLLLTGVFLIMGR